MAWSIFATPYMGSLPGAMHLAVTGDPGAVVSITRHDRDGSHPVRNTDTPLTASGLGQFVDPEAPFYAVTYTVRFGGVDRATSDPATVPGMPGGFALLRSVLRPDVQWMPVTFIDEEGTEYPTSSTAFEVVGSHDLVVVGDVRRRRRGTFVFGPRTVAEADELVFLLRDGIPFLLRLCPHGGGVWRDTMFYALNVTETRFGYEGKRLVIVDYQSVDFVEGDTEVPPAGTWLYSDLAANTDATVYGAIPPVRRDYLDLVLHPLAHP
jgi:hypothetical protein